eukprot:782104-Pelagomonas_calceolata.AAC.1
MFQGTAEWSAHLPVHVRICRGGLLRSARPILQLQDRPTRGCSGHGAAAAAAAVAAAVKGEGGRGIGVNLPAAALAATCLTQHQGVRGLLVEAAYAVDASARAGDTALGDREGQGQWAVAGGGLGGAGRCTVAPAGERRRRYGGGAQHLTGAALLVLCARGLDAA